MMGWRGDEVCLPLFIDMEECMEEGGCSIVAKIIITNYLFS
jgi:hypothetical protein